MNRSKLPSFGNKPPLILCVDDDRAYVRLRKAQLEGEGYHVIAAVTADEAIQALRENSICVTVSDTGTTGTRLAARMKKVKPKVPIILNSDNCPDSLENFDAFIEKDESSAKLLSLINDILGRYLS